MRTTAALGWVLAAAATAVGAATVAAPSDALACGGCFAPSMTQQVVTDHRMVMAVHSDRSVLWDQIRYTGNPADFSWVLPVSGAVDIQVGSPEFFDQLDEATAVTVRGPVIQRNCPNNFGFGPSARGASADSFSDAAPPPVQVLSQQTVGPYDTVVLRSTDSGALTAWLRENRYVIPPSIEPVIQFYTEHHMDFVALRLSPGEGVSAMQPVRIVYHTANMVLPLRMVAAGIADKVGISLWVFGLGRHEAGNFANGTISERDLVWDWDRNEANYRDVFRDTLRALGGRAWITEYAQDALNLGYRFQSDVWDRDAGAQVPNPAAEDWELATRGNTAGVWVTRMRTDLAAQFLDTDLLLQASADNTRVSNQLNTTGERGTRPEPRCPSSGGAAVGGGSGLACAVLPGRAARRSAGYVTVGLLAGALTLVVARRRRRGDRAQQ